MNWKWSQQIASSVNIHFQQNCVSSSDVKFQLLYEGMLRDEKVVNSQNVIEVRFGGPKYFREQGSRWKASLIINCLLQTNITETSNYTIWKMIGKTNEALSIPIRIYDFEINPDEELGCLVSQNNLLNNFLGQVEFDLPRLQAEVSCAFSIDLEN